MKKTLVKVLAVAICAIMLLSLSGIAFADDGSTARLITSRTEDFVLGKGKNAEISVEAASETIFKWEISTDGGTNWSAASEATNTATYSITNAQINTPAQQPYLYRVTVTNASSQTDSAVISVLVSDDYITPPETVSLRSGDMELTGYIHKKARLEVTPLTVGSAEETKLRSALSADGLPLIACSPSLTNRSSQDVPYFGALKVTFHVGDVYNGQKLWLRQLIGDKVSSYLGEVSNGALSINVSTLSPFMVEVSAAGIKTITVSTGTGGSVMPSGEVNVGSGTDKTLTFLPDVGYAVNEVTVDNAPVSFAGNSYKLESIDENHTVNVSFRRVTPSDSFHTVTISYGEHGKVSPTGSLKVRHGGAQTVYFYPESYYELDKVLIDDAEVSVIGSSYTLTAVETDTTVVVSFRPATSQLPDEAKTINSSAGVNGSIYPSGKTCVEYGGEMYYYFVPDIGYVVDVAAVDGVAVSVTGNCYHFSDVTASRSISVTFKKRPMPTYSTPTYNVAVECGDGGINAFVTVSNGTAAVTVSDAKLGELLGSNKTTDSVRIDAGLGKKVYAVQIPAAVVDKIAKAAIDTEKSITGLTVTTDTGTVELDGTALAALSGQSTGGDVTACIEKAEQTDLTASQRETLTGDHADATVVQVTVKSGSAIISDYNGGKITVTVPYTLRDGEASDGICVWHLAADGSLTLMECSYDAATKTVSFVTDHLSDYIIGYDEIAAWVNPFTDVKKSDWFYENVAYASIAGLMEGTGSATFAPDTGASRAMIVTILWRLENKPTMGAGKSSTFVDVPESEWYTEAVEWAAASGLVNGFEDSTFRQTENISREQLATILWRYAKYKGYDVSVGENTNILSYTDAESISEYAVPAMQWVCGAGLMQGDAGALMPGGSANRAQVAAILHRFSGQNTGAA